MKQFDDVEKKSSRECRIKRMMRGKLGGGQRPVTVFYSRTAESICRNYPESVSFFFLSFFLQMNAVKKWRGNNDEWVRGSLRDKGGGIEMLVVDRLYTIRS